MVAKISLAGQEVEFASACKRSESCSALAHSRRSGGALVCTKLSNACQRPTNSSEDVRIGAETSISRGCYFEGRGLVDIGPSCMVGPEVAFLTSKHGVGSDGTVDRIPTYLPITVGAGSWIGARATVLGGAEIGPGVIVTAGSDSAHQGLHAELRGGHVN